MTEHAECDRCGHVTACERVGDYRLCKRCRDVVGRRRLTKSGDRGRVNNRASGP